MKAPRKIYQNETIYLPDLARTNHVISGTFDGCDIRGPAIVVPLGNCSMDGTELNVEDNDVETILWEVPEGAKRIGAIGLQDCRFVNCRFQGIGFAGSQEQLRGFRGMGEAA
jgi:hypothetical protein